MTIKMTGVEGNTGLLEKLEVFHDGTRVSEVGDMMGVCFSLFRSFLLVIWLKRKIDRLECIHRRVPRKVKKHKVLLCAQNEGSGILNPEKRMSVET